MDKIEFLVPFETLCHRYSKPAKKELTNVYYSRLRRMPAAIFSEIVNLIIDNDKYFPTPGRIKAEFHQYLESHPEKKAHKNMTPCDYCDGNGYLEYRYYKAEHSQHYNAICRCAHCDNWRAQEIPSHYPQWTVKNITERGHELTRCTAFNVEYMETDKRYKLKGIKECVDMVGKEVPEIKHFVGD